MMKQNNMLCGVITALVTPMYPDGRIDFDSLSDLVEFQLKHHIDGLAVAGSTGEGSLLTNDEKIKVLQHVIKVNNKRAKIIMIFNDIATHSAVDFVQRLNAIDGIDYYTATNPGYVRPTQAGLYEHFKTIANKSIHPILLYNIPLRTGCDLENKTFIRLVTDCPNIVGLKDSTANIARIGDLLLHRERNFALYSGDDATSLAFVLSGGDGSISVASNLVPDQYKTIITHALQGNKLASVEANNKLYRLLNVLSLESNPVALKWALSFMGIIRHDSVRLPLCPLTLSSQEKIKPVLMEL